jgi:hypothetical protein
MRDINKYRGNKPSRTIINFLIIIACLPNLSSIRLLIMIPASRMIDHVGGVKLCRPSEREELDFHTASH